MDLITYPLGEQITLRHLTVYRAPSLFFIRSVKPGFSLAKILLDLLLFCTALGVLARQRYVALHTHEEAALIGIVLAFLFRCKHVYYMHSDLSQLVWQRCCIAPCMRALQTLMVRRADAVIAFYPELVSLVESVAPGKPVFLIAPTAVVQEVSPQLEEAIAALRRRWRLDGRFVLLYTGTLEAYQGIELLLRSARIVQAVSHQLGYILIGGTPRQVERLQRLAESLGVAEVVRFVGQRPLEEMALYMTLADVLVSPRCHGTHVPLKLYTYLQAGKPILATEILSHTQVLTPDISCLVPPTAEGLAQGTLELLGNPHWARALGRAGRRLAQEHYSWTVFLERCRQVHEQLAS